MKHIYLNLKRFDIPRAFGGVNSLAPVNEWAKTIIEGTADYVRLPEGGTGLDVGCGSGILAICAKLLGSGRTVGVDIDPVAVRTAKENAELNNCGDIELLCGDLATDIEGKFYERHARILSALGVVNGYANNLFKGEANITREELAAILVRYVYLFGDGIVFDEPIDSFKDADKISDWAVDVVDAAREMGIFKGDNGNFKPRSNALRSEVAQTMLRMEVYNGMLASY